MSQRKRPVKVVSLVSERGIVYTSVEKEFKFCVFIGKEAREGCVLGGFG